ncbi:MAG: 3-deoxy-D-manno-octulosonic acid transferase [Bacteroidetes bacterium]|nr:3-deoxy-D-manno-octulosonic acid transferase [Bacteroidota bacterium]
MRFLYTLFILLYQWAAKIYGLFNIKARQWAFGRKGLTARIVRENEEQQEYIWFHCASLGEFEMGRPVMEAILNKYPRYKLLLTFFSPSGYEHRKNYKPAHRVYYLPSDTPQNARTFINTFQPVLAVFIKYEFWYNYFRELKRHNIPLILISAVFRNDQPFFRWYGAWFRKQLNLIDHIYTQDDASANFLEKINYKNFTIAGDTRFDRVMETAEKAEDIDLIRHFAGEAKLIVAGSTWPADEEIILPAMNTLPENIKLVIAPHQVDENHISRIVEMIKEPVARYTKVDPNQIGSYRVLVIDTIGILSRTYKYAWIAYVGGAFGSGLHNILEPAAFGVPVVFGPDHQKFHEAGKLVSKGGAFSIKNHKEFLKIVNGFLDNPEYYSQTCTDVRNFMREHRGASRIIMKDLEKFLADQE